MFLRWGNCTLIQLNEVSFVNKQKSSAQCGRLKDKGVLLEALHGFTAVWRWTALLGTGRLNVAFNFTEPKGLVLCTLPRDTQHS